MSKLKKGWWVILILLLAHLAQFWPFYFQHLLPFPGDMLVAFHFPWSGGGFVGFDRWTQYKALNTVDTIKQFYPWKVFAMDLVRRGIWPLWNPYSFSGMPLIANLQSGIFFPLNFIYLFVPVLVGWVGNVLFQLVIFGWFFYLFLRSEKLSRLAAVFGAVVGMNMSYIALWHWQLVITQSLLFLPLILYLTNLYAENRRKVYLAIVAALLAFCLFGGHAQSTGYVYTLFGLNALRRKISLKWLVTIFVISIVLAAVQLLPSAQTYLLSAREGQATKELFAPFVFHWQNIITTVAPDFFGHPTNRNYVGTDYRDMNGYFGLTAFIFAILSLDWWKKNKSVRYFLFITLTGLLLATPPLVFLFDIFNIPIYSSGVPARTIFLFQFGGAVLAAFGFERWWQSKEKYWRELGVIAVIIAGLWIWVLLKHDIVARNNLVLPTGIFLATSSLILFRTRLALAGIFAVLFLQYSYFFQKYNSFAPEKFVFPDHPILAFLRTTAGVNRFYGTEQAILSQDFSVYYHLYDFKGYDSMYPKRYGELVAAAKTGKIPKVIPRSDAYISDWSSRLSERLLDLVGTKYLLDKNDMIVTDWEPQPAVFSPQRYQLVWQARKWRIFERTTAMPRAALLGSFVVEKDDEKIVEKLYDPQFDYQNQVVLEEIPAIAVEPTDNKSVSIISYQPNRVELETQADKPQLLYLSDNFYPDWFVTIDGKAGSILRADYTFRAVALMQGKHDVVFYYDPPAFKIGLAISLVSFVGLGGLILWRRKS